MSLVYPLAEFPRLTPTPTVQEDANFCHTDDGYRITWTYRYDGCSMTFHIGDQNAGWLSYYG